MPALRSLTGPTAETAPFPPTDLTGFLRCCEGSWMSLRSRFDLSGVTDAEPAQVAADATDAAADTEASGESWHQSERGELEVRFVADDAEGAPGGLVSHPAGGSAQQLRFQADGQFEAGELEAMASGATGGTAIRRGSWTLWPDGSLELSMDHGNHRISERIWFTKPNLRLRSTVEHLSLIHI